MIHNAISEDIQPHEQVQTVQAASALGSKGARVFRLRPGDKRPRLKGSFKDATSDLSLIASQFQPGENVGAATGHEFGGSLVVIDIDVPKDSGGIPLAQTIVVQRLLRLFATVVGAQQAADLINNALWVQTSSGGWQLWFVAERGAFLASRDHLDLSAFDPDGVHGPASDDTSCDTRGEGGYAVAPGSATVERTETGEDGSIKIKQSAGTYQAYWRSEPVAPSDLPDFNLLPLLPAALIEAINALPKEGDTPRTLPKALPNDAAGNHATSIFSSAPEYATQGKEESGTFKIGQRAPKNPQRVRDALSYSVSQAPDRYKSRQGWLEVMIALAGAAATGELAEEEADAIYEWFCTSTPGNKNQNESQWHTTKKLAHERLRNSEDVRGCKSIIDQSLADGWLDTAVKPIDTDHSLSANREEWPGGVKQEKNGVTPLSNSPNAGAMLERMGFKFRFVTRGYYHEVLTPEKYVTAAMPAGWQAIGDTQARQLTDLVIKAGLRSIKLEVVVQAFKTLGDLVPFDPFKAMLESLPEWDGLDRIEDFPSRYLGAQPKGITAAWAKHFFMLLMARTYQPGCKADEMLILLGAQRTGKSSALRAIVGSEFFDDNLTLNDSAQVLIEKTQRVALVEIAELQGLSGRNADKNKAMISRQTDRARLAFGRSTSIVPRCCVLAGTGNEMAPFMDPTGALRFMPITVGVVDVAGIERDRGQILAEALHKFRVEFGGDAERVLLDPQWWDEAKKETEKYQNIDPWEDTITAMLVDSRDTLKVWTNRNGEEGFFLVSNDLLLRLLPPGHNKTGADAQRLGRIMRRLGFTNERPMIERKRETGYFRPFNLEEQDWHIQKTQAEQQADASEAIAPKPALSVV